MERLDSSFSVPQTLEQSVEGYFAGRFECIDRLVRVVEVRVRNQCVCGVRPYLMEDVHLKTDKTVLIRKWIESNYSLFNVKCLMNLIIVPDVMKNLLFEQMGIAHCVGMNGLGVKNYLQSLMPRMRNIGGSLENGFVRFRL